MSKSGHKLKVKEVSKHKGRTRVPYGPLQAEPDAAPAATRSTGSAGKTVLKVGAAIALPFLLRAVLKAATR